MKWEALADKALIALTLPEMQSVYLHYQERLKTESGSTTSKALSIIAAEIQSVCKTNQELKPHLDIAFVMSEIQSDSRISHLIGGSGRYIINLDEALEKAIAAQNPSNKNDNAPNTPSNT